MDGYLEIRLGDYAYAIAVAAIHEIERVGDITPLPNNAPHICGLMNLRGRVLPVIDLKVRLGLPRASHTRETCILVVGGENGLVGLLVDSVRGVIEAALESVLPPPANCHLAEKSLVRGLLKESNRVVTVLSIQDCLAAPLVPPTPPLAVGFAGLALKLLS